MAAHPIDLVLFDLGGVLIDWNPDYLYRKLIPDDREREIFLTQVCHPLWNFQQDRGRSWDQAVQEATAKHPDKAELIAAYRDRWAEMLNGPIDGTVLLLKELHVKNAVRLAALTNWSAETFPIARQRFDFLALFEQIFVSGVLKLAKPDPRIFEHTLTNLKVSPESVLFIDDNMANVTEARMMGLQCHQFTTPQKLRACLSEFSLL